ncbi:hypothetical protein DFP72DRAFT_855838 [Ephemerocybe angulata]|uniref:Uncharacterized protein n=1 Tax=Ephemerocybe angulata TaxID=980116 RepID=A0A8H6HFR8_9AGAR|nr:hypothetical protein DFP72DRAFT_855838 [Tulosesus angulatus]
MGDRVPDSVVVDASAQGSLVWTSLSSLSTPTHHPDLQCLKLALKHLATIAASKLYLVACVFAIQYIGQDWRLQKILHSAKTRSDSGVATVGCLWLCARGTMSGSAERGKYMEVAAMLRDDTWEAFWDRAERKAVKRKEGQSIGRVGDEDSELRGRTEAPISRFLDAASVMVLVTPSRTDFSGTNGNKGRINGGSIDGEGSSTLTDASHASNYLSRRAACSGRVIRNGTLVLSENGITGTTGP